MSRLICFVALVTLMCAAVWAENCPEHMSVIQYDWLLLGDELPARDTDSLTQYNIQLVVSLAPLTEVPPLPLQWLKLCPEEFDETHKRVREIIPAHVPVFIYCIDGDDLKEALNYYHSLKSVQRAEPYMDQNELSKVLRNVPKLESPGLQDGPAAPLRRFVHIPVQDIEGPPILEELSQALRTLMMPWLLEEAKHEAFVSASVVNEEGSSNEAEATAPSESAGLPFATAPIPELSLSDLRTSTNDPHSSRVLLHCKKGQSRSPAALMAMLMNPLGTSREEGYVQGLKLRPRSLKTLYRYFKKVRPCVQPNFHWFQQLLDLELKLFPELEGVNTITHAANYIPIELGPPGSPTQDTTDPKSSVSYSNNSLTGGRLLQLGHVELGASLTLIILVIYFLRRISAKPNELEQQHQVSIKPKHN